MTGQVDAGAPRTGGHYDVAVAGGGAVGATLACALAESGSRVLLADPSSGSTAPTGAFAPRPLALSLSSQNALAALGIWEDLESAATPIESIHVSEANRFGATRLEATACGVPRFGSVIAAGALGNVLRGAAARRDRIRRVGGRVAGPRVSSGVVESHVIPEGGGEPHSFAASLLGRGRRGALGAARRAGHRDDRPRLSPVRGGVGGSRTHTARTHGIRAIHARRTGSPAANGWRTLRTRLELRRGARRPAGRSVRTGFHRGARCRLRGSIRRLRLGRRSGRVRSAARARGHRRLRSGRADRKCREPPAPGRGAGLQPGDARCRVPRGCHRVGTPRWRRPRGWTGAGALPAVAGAGIMPRSPGSPMRSSTSSAIVALRSRGCARQPSSPSTWRRP